MWKPDELSELDYKLSKKIGELASNLGIEVESPFSLECNNKKFIYSVLIKGFGYKNSTSGILLRAHPESFEPEQCGEIWSIATGKGFLVSNITESGIENMNEENLKADFFKELLWQGSLESKPIWHNDKSYDSE